MENRLGKRLLAIVGAAAMLMNLLGCGGSRQHIKTESGGTCGENLTWEYNKRTQTLTITGSGAMNTPSRFMWSDYPIKKLVISEGVTSIDAEAFYSNGSLRGELKLPSTLKTIGRFAFYGCEALTGALVLPDSLESVGEYAFTRCKGFGSIQLSASLRSIGDEAFAEMKGLKGTLVLPEGLESIGRCGFNECVGLQGDLILPDSLTALGTSTFDQCGFDGTIRLSEGLTEIPSNCFCSCESVKGSLEIPSSVRSIGDSAFRGCSFDGTLSLPEGLESIGRYAFADCGELKGTLVIPESVVFLGDAAFRNDEGLTSLRLPAGLTLICESTFRDCAGMSGELKLPEALLVIGDMAFSGTGFSGVLALPEGLRSLGMACFSGCAGLTQVSLPSSLEHIKKNAFLGCSALSGLLNIPDAVVSIGNSAFSGTGIEEVRFGASVRSIGERAFRNCESLSSAVFTGARNPDYYGPEEDKPSFPEGCLVEAPGEVSWYERRIRPTATPEPGGTDDGVAREMPYFWTNELNDRIFTGGGAFADVTLSFEGSRILCEINGRLFAECEFTADANDDEQKIIINGALRCLDAECWELRFNYGWRRDAQLFTELVFDDGKTRRVVFHTASEEALYMENTEAAWN